MLFMLWYRWDNGLWPRLRMLVSHHRGKSLALCVKTEPQGKGIPGSLSHGVGYMLQPS